MNCRLYAMSCWRVRIVRYRRVAYTYPKTRTGKLRPLGIPSLRDRIVERAMLMAMQPIWESDFHSAFLRLSDPSAAFTMRSERSSFQLQDGDESEVWRVAGL